MHPFEQTISVVGPIVGGIILLSLFFYTMAWLGNWMRGMPSKIGFRGIFDKHTVATVHLANGTAFVNVRLVAFTSNSGKGLPYELGNMVILEHDDGRRTLVPAKSIRMIDIPRAG